MQTRWETPSFVEINMDAEIGGYQDDLGDPPDITDQREQPTAAVTVADGGVTALPTSAC